MAELGIRGPAAPAVGRAAVAGAGAWGCCAAGSLGYALSTGLGPHRVWGALAALAYAVVALLTYAGAGRAETVSAVAVGGAVVLPLAVLVAGGRGQLEVAVVERSGARLLATGSPYVADPATVADVNPYLPGTALFGALPGDPRWWTAGVFVACVAAAASGVRSWWLVACPVVALPAAVGGVDLPVVGLMCLGLVWAGRGRAVGGGLLLGAAACLKWTGWPGIVVGAVLAASAGRARAGDGLRAAPSLIGAGPRRAGATGRYGSAAPDARVHRGAGTRLVLTALGVVAVGVGPVALGAPHALYDNVVRFPLGLGELASPADSPLPGRLLATHVDGGAGLAVALLALAAVAVAGSLAVRPPGTVRAAADRLAVGLGAAMLLMPASRFGYLVYPLVLWAVPRCADRRQGVRA